MLQFFFIHVMFQKIRYFIKIKNCCCNKTNNNKLSNIFCFNPFLVTQKLLNMHNLLNYYHIIDEKIKIDEDSLIKFMSERNISDTELYHSKYMKIRNYPMINHHNSLPFLFLQ